MIGQGIFGNRRIVAAIAVALLLSLAVELWVPARRQTQAFDENNHIFAGYSYWKSHDFGFNPEHPPLVKLLAGLPVLAMNPRTVPFPDMMYKGSASVAGSQMLYGNNADAILFRARMAVALLTLLLATLVFAAAFEMAGPAAAIVALALFVFEPNLIAHGGLVTTDMGAALFFFATVYAFYRYCWERTAVRLAAVSVALGFALAAKHSMVLIFPTLVLLALVDILFPAEGKTRTGENKSRGLLSHLGALVLTGVVACAILWAFYGFRYAARPAGHVMIPPLEPFLAQLASPRNAEILSFAARHHLFPEAYLFGWTDILSGHRSSGGYLFGKAYPQAHWFYFPSALLIKCTLGFLFLVAIAAIAAGSGRSKKWGQLFFLLIPAGVYLAAAMTSDFNIGIRHILPIFPLLIVFIAAALGALIQRDRRWLAAVALLVALHVGSSAFAFPVNYIPYSNELWGGPSQTYKVLTDSNVDWGQQLKDVHKYLDAHGEKNCWFAYLARISAPPGYYGIQCTALPAGFNVLTGVPIGPVSEHVQGTVLLSATELSGALWGPGSLNPYGQFKELKPDAIIDGGVVVFNGQFSLPLAAAISHALESSSLLRGGKIDQAHTEAEAAVALAPDDPLSQIALGDALTSLGRNEDAQKHYKQALSEALSNEPEFRRYLVSLLQEKILRGTSSGAGQKL